MTRYRDRYLQSAMTKATLDSARRCPSGVPNCTGTSAVLQCPACARSAVTSRAANKAVKAWEDLHASLADLHVAVMAQSGDAEDIITVRRKLIETGLWDILDRHRR